MFFFANFQHYCLYCLYIITADSILLVCICIFWREGFQDGFLMELSDDWWLIIVTFYNAGRVTKWLQWLLWKQSSNGDTLKVWLLCQEVEAQDRLLRKKIIQDNVRMSANQLKICRRWVMQQDSFYIYMNALTFPIKFQYFFLSQ